MKVKAAAKAHMAQCCAFECRAPYLVSNTSCSTAIAVRERK